MHVDFSDEARQTSKISKVPSAENAAEDEPDDEEEICEEEITQLAESRPPSRVPSQQPSDPAINPTLALLLQDDGERPELGVEEVNTVILGGHIVNNVEGQPYYTQPIPTLFQIFDILPLYGSLKPGDTEQITLTFFGHADVSSAVQAICEVEGGPAYQLDLKGEASLVDYRFDCLDIDYGKIVSYFIFVCMYLNDLAKRIG